MRMYNEVSLRSANQGCWVYEFGDNQELLRNEDRQNFLLNNQPIYRLVPTGIRNQIVDLFWINHVEIDNEYESVLDFHNRNQLQGDNKLEEKLIESPWEIMELLRIPPRNREIHYISLDAPVGFELRRNLGPFNLAQLLQDDPGNLQLRNRLIQLRSQCTPGSTFTNRVQLQRENAWRGVRTPTFIPGMPGSTFCIHTEVEDVASVNLLVWGSPKIWFVVPPAYYRTVIELIRELYHPDGCANPTRHKDLFPDPAILRERGIPVRRVVQRVGDMIVLLPRAFHFG